VTSNIFYFSGTGNSLAIARELAERTKGRLISIPSVLSEESIRSETEVIGIVFPVYFRAILGGIPHILRRFVAKLDNLASKYIYAVSTYGLGGPVFRILDEYIQSKGGRLAASFSIKMPYYYLALAGLGDQILRKQQDTLSTASRKLELIRETIEARMCTKTDPSNPILNAILGLPGKAFYYLTLRKLADSGLPLDELLFWIDRGFHVDEKCDRCGICVRLCPVGNIKYDNNKLTWLHHCEQCCSCIQYCPKKAISLNGKSPAEKKFHHPGISVNDLFWKGDAR
jgi:ferredoxin